MTTDNNNVNLTPCRDAIEVAMGCDQKYFCGLLVTAVSMAENCNPDKLLSFNFLDGGINPGCRRELERHCQAVHSNCRFNWVIINKSRFHGFPKFLDKGLMTYSRLLLPELLPSCKHVIYCDVDFLWFADIAELWAQKSDSIFLQSVADGANDHRLNESGWYAKHGYTFDSAKYFCAGMCMLNLDMMRKENATLKLLDFIASNPDIKAHDQTALTIICHSRSDVRMLENQWQLRTAPLVVKKIEHRPVLHFAADAPWRSITGTHLLTDFHLLWFHSYAKINGISPWKAMRKFYSAWRLISSRALFLIGTLPFIGPPLLKQSMRLLAPNKSYETLIPFLSKAPLHKSILTHKANSHKMRAESI